MGWVFKQEVKRKRKTKLKPYYSSSKNQKKGKSEFLISLILQHPNGLELEV